MSGEAASRANIDLPGVQPRLLEAIHATGTPIVLVVMSGRPLTIPWAAEHVPAIVESWFLGIETGPALAAVLFGDVSPSGKLPVTFPAREADAPTAFPERYPGVNGQQQYSEGVLVGYRWYDTKDITPLFPFGHGLSYTQFRYSDLGITPTGGGYDVSFRVRNTGAQKGAEVAQVYVGAPSGAPVPMARQSLVGFERVELVPGEERRMTVHVGAQPLSYWSVARHDWVVLPGRRSVQVGSSSRDVRLRGWTSK